MDPNFKIILRVLDLGLLDRFLRELLLYREELFCYLASCCELSSSCSSCCSLLLLALANWQIWRLSLLARWLCEEITLSMTCPFTCPFTSRKVYQQQARARKCRASSCHFFCEGVFSRQGFEVKLTTSPREQARVVPAAADVFLRSLRACCFFPLFPRVASQKNSS